jgi:hypothetical protein
VNTDPRILSTYTRRTVAPFVPVPGALLVEGAESLVPVHRDAAGEWARRVVIRDALYAELRGPARPGHIARLALAADEATTIWVRTVRPQGAVGFIDADGAFIVPMARHPESQSASRIQQGLPTGFQGVGDITHARYQNAPIGNNPQT